MSERQPIITIDRMKRFAAPLLLGAFITGVTAGVVTQRVSDPENNLCAQDNPSFQDFNPNNDLIANAHDALVSLGDSDEVSEAEGDFIETALNQEYGVSLTFPESAREDDVFTFGTINDDPVRKQKAVTSSLRGITTALGMFSPRMIKALNLKELPFVKGIVKKPEYKQDNHILDAAGGMYSDADSRIYIDVEQLGDGIGSRVSGVIVHELSHAIDAKLLCGNHDVNVDTAFTQYNTQQYLGYSSEGHKVDQKFIKPSKTREFVDDYGITSPAEDRATIVQWTFTQRGLILEGDRDWESPLRHKQEEIVNRLDNLAQGTRAFLQKQTEILRDQNFNNELDDNIESALFPGEIMAADDVVHAAAAMESDLEILSNGVLTINRPEGGAPQLVERPIIVRDPAGKITAVAWGNGKAHDISAKFFDTHSMSIYTSEADPKLEKGTPLIADEHNLYLNDFGARQHFLSDPDFGDVMSHYPHLAHVNAL